MSLLKQGWALALMILSLLFLPQEKLAFWFADRPQDWYGELAIPGLDREFILAKNRSPYSVELRSQSARVIGARSLAGSPLSLSKNSPSLPRDVYVLLEEHRPAPSPRRRNFTGVLTDFAPPRLYVGTEAEDDVAIMLLLLGAGLMAALGLSIGLFFHDAALMEIDSTKESRSQ